MSDTTNISFISTKSFEDELIYDTAMVSKVLGVQESTIRKYCALLQKHHYEFNKNTVGHRIFYRKDIETLKKMIDLKNSGALTLTEAVKTVLASDTENHDDISGVESISKPDYKELLEEFQTFKQEQMTFNQQLFEQLQQQQEYIKKSIEDRDQKLMLALKESMEARRQLAAAEAVAIEEKKKKSWWKFWE